MAEKLDEAATLLETQGANPFRVSAYRRAAGQLRDWKEPISELLSRRGTAGLKSIPGIGESLGRAIEEICQTGRFGLIDRLQGESSPERLFRTVAGIGPRLARSLHEELGLESLEGLEEAAYDGRLEQLALMGPKRVRAIREALAGRFRRRPQVPESRPKPQEQFDTPVEEILDVDREYRDKAKHHELPRIAPRRFNPTHESWLPVLHTSRESRHYTALFSNTARAHELGTIRDWVVIYRDDDGKKAQWTVVTGHYGPLSGKRVIRGMENACKSFYAPRLRAVKENE